MNYRGRPFRFVALIGGGWISARVLLLWPVTGSLPEAIRQVLPFTSSRAETASIAPAATPSRPAIRMGSPAPAVASVSARRTADPALVQLALLGLVRYGAERQRYPRPERLASQPPVIAALPRARMSRPSATRLSGSAWFVARGDGGGSKSDQRLGGGQAGLRLRYRIDAADRLALAARIATPLGGVGREAAIGVEWRPGVVPIALVVEQRFGIDGAKGGPAVMAIGGVDGVPIAAGFKLSSYAQAGIVARARIDPFVDGAMRITRPVAQIGGVPVELGLGAWGVAQRGAARLDLGPGVALAIPVAGRSFRVGLDWRERVSGNAAPGSGLTLSLGTDF